MRKFLKREKTEWLDSGTRTTAGYRDDGSPIIRGAAPELRPAGEYFLAEDGQARDLIASGKASEAKLSGTFAALLEAVLPAEGSKQAALAALPLHGVTVWHGEVINGEMRPARGSFGPTRHSGYFGSAAEIEAHWSANPAAVPVFSLDFENGAFRKSFRFKAGGLLEIMA